MNFTFVPKVDAALFNTTKGAWTQQIQDNPESVSQAYYEARLDYLERAVDGKTHTADGGGGVCAVIEDGGDVAAALITVAHAPGKSSLKMLDVTVQPRLNLADSEPNIPELAWIAAELITGCLDLTYREYPSKELKIYTTFPLDKKFMTAVTTAMMRNAEFSKLFDVSTHGGSWLVVTKKAEQGSEA